MHTKIILAVALALLTSIGSYTVYQSQVGSIKNAILTVQDVQDMKFENLEELALRLGEFHLWTQKYSKSYSISEAQYRFKTWYDNYKVVEEHNSKNLTWTLELNMFADLSDDEFTALHTGFAPELQLDQDNEERIDESLIEGNAENNIDWRSRGAIGSIRNQGQCGGCWAFATCATLEAVYKIRRGSLPDLSEQQLIDCSGNYGNQGCNGGTMVNAYRYTQASGVERENNYPYRQVSGNCRHNSGASLFRNAGYKQVSQSASAIKSAVNGRPVAVGVESSGSAFKFYKGGVITGNCGTRLDHAITIVGISNGNWIVRNQWGSGWGESGYVRIASGSQNGGQGLCGINTQASYPTL